MMKSAARFALPALLAVTLCQCGAPSPPRCSRVPVSSRAPAEALLQEARQSWAILSDPSRKSDWASAEKTYNSDVAKLFDQVHCSRGSWSERAARIGTTIASSNLQTADPEEFDALFPASKVSIRKEGERHLTEGLGISLVGWKETTPINVPRPAFQPPTGMPYPMNATLRFDRKGRPVWHFIKRWIDDDVELAGGRHLLSSDWTAPNVFYWKMSNLDNLKVQNVCCRGAISMKPVFISCNPTTPKKFLS